MHTLKDLGYTLELERPHTRYYTRKIKDNVTQYIYLYNHDETPDGTEPWWKTVECYVHVDGTDNWWKERDSHTLSYDELKIICEEFDNWNVEGVK